ncbi:MAG: zinc-ribbon domain containing protein [Patescibacteria group bacterium]
MNRDCKKCGTPFEITDEDLKFYEKVESPTPTRCPDCRRQRRLAIRNDVSLYQRKCDHSGKIMISMFSPDKPYKVYHPDVWWSDKWDPMDHGQDFDLKRPFFEQFKELQLKVPRMGLNSIGNINSEYANYAFRNKSSYLVFTADFNEDCYYSRFADSNVHSCDMAFSWNNTFCYETVDVYGCNAAHYSQKCYNSSNLNFCYNMRGCHNCIFCANLSNKTHHILNKRVEKEEYGKFLENLQLTSSKGVERAWFKYKDFLQSQPRKYLEVVQCEDCLGDYLKSSKNAQHCFDCFDLYDTKYITHCHKLQDCYDWDFVGVDSSLCYEMSSCAHNLFNCKFSMNCWDGNKNLTYCDLCLGNEDLFGCIALRKKKHCILNKQYSPEEYESLKEKIIAHMKETGEYGEFFPIEISPWGYNETVAQEYYPLTKESALAKGYKWQDKDEREYQKQSYEIPEDIKDVPNKITKEILACTCCGKNYKITEQELRHYKKIGVPIPRKCFNCRHADRIALRNKRKIFDRKCSKCNTDIKTSYAGNRPEPVLCEECYLKEVF